MYSVTPEYIAKIKATGVKRRRITGRVDNIPFTTEDVVQDSFTYTNQIAKNSDITLGGVFVGTLKIGFMKTYAQRIARKSWRGRKIQIAIDLKTGNDPQTDEEIWESVPIGIFTIDEAEHSAKGVSVTAYDNMALFDKALNVNTLEGYPFQILSMAARECHVQLGQTEQQIQAMANGGEFLGLYPDNDISTYRDLISWTAAALAGFATMNREGKLEIRSFKPEADITIDKYNRAAGGSWSDFDTYYTGVNLTDIESETAKHYGQEHDTGLTMNLGANPLLQFGTEETKTERAMNIVNALENFNYTPFKCAGFIDPALDLGDVIECTEGLAGTASNCMVMKITMQFNRGIKLEGFGKNPAMFGAQSKTDKNISGLISKMGGEENKITIVSQTNLETITIGNDWQPVVHMRIGVLQSQIVQLHGVIKLDLTEAGTVWVRYTLNGEALLFKHVCQFPIGPETITLFIPLAITNEFVNDVLIEIQSGDGTGTIAAEDAKIIIQGVGVTTGNWDGYIEATDSFAFPFQQGLGFAYEETANTELDTNSQSVHPTASDSFALYFQQGLGFAYAETATTELALETYVSRIATEDGNVIIRTEDGQNRIITEV